jgi:hypothetical protein
MPPTNPIFSVLNKAVKQLKDCKFSAFSDRNAPSGKKRVVQCLSALLEKLSGGDVSGLLLAYLKQRRNAVTLKVVYDTLCTEKKILCRIAQAFEGTNPCDHVKRASYLGFVCEDFSLVKLKELGFYPLGDKLLKRVREHVQANGYSAPLTSQPCGRMCVSEEVITEIKKTYYLHSHEASNRPLKKLKLNALIRDFTHQEIFRDLPENVNLSASSCYKYRPQECKTAKRESDYCHSREEFKVLVKKNTLYMKCLKRNHAKFLSNCNTLSDVGASGLVDRLPVDDRTKIEKSLFQLKELSFHRAAKYRQHAKFIWDKTKLK